MKLSDHVVKGCDKTFKGSMVPMVDLGTYAFSDLETGEITPQESFMHAYTGELYESERARFSTKQLRVILDDKYEKSVFK